MKKTALTISIVFLFLVVAYQQYQIHQLKQQNEEIQEHNAEIERNIRAYFETI